MKTNTPTLSQLITIGLFVVAYTFAFAVALQWLSKCMGIVIIP